MIVLLFLLLFIPSGDAHTVSLVARIGKTISLLKVDPVTLHLHDSRILYKPIAEELHVLLASNANENTGYFTLRQHLRRLPLDGSLDTTALTIGGVLDDTPTSVAYDWLTGKIYAAISTIGHDSSARIEVCNETKNGTTPQVCTVILHDRLDYLHSLVLDPLDGNMYWINAARNQIERAFMNGLHHDTHPFSMPTPDGTLTSLALSREANSIFYVRTTKDSSEVWKCELYQRQSCIPIFETSHILHLDTVQTFLFFSLNSGHLAICDWTNCNGTFHIVEQIMDLEMFTIVDSKKAVTDPSSNPCAVNNGGCSHLCLIASIAPKRTCACPIGIDLKSDGVTCEDGFREVLLISAINGLFYISLDTTDYTPQSFPYGGEDEASHSLLDVDYDPVEGFVYWLDITDYTIKRCRFNGSDLAVVINEGIHQSTKTFRLDINGRNIFWVDGATSLIWVGKMDGSLVPRVLQTSIRLEKPHGLAVDPFDGYLYVSDWAERNSKLIKMQLDGSNAEVFYNLQEYSYPTGVDLDREGGRLYWAESNHSLIRSIKLDATDLLSYMQYSYKLVQPYSVSKLGNRIYCNSMAGRSFVEIVLKDGILAGHDSSRVVESQIYGPVGLRAVRLNETVERSGPCSVNNGGCQHFCFNTPGNGSKCLCSKGEELLLDKQSCRKPDQSVVILDSMKYPDLWRLSIEGNRNLERLFVQALIGNPHAIIFDEKSEIVYAVMKNETGGAIQSIRVSNSTPTASKIISGVTLRGIHDVAVDNPGQILFWTNSEFGRIHMSSLDGKYEKVMAWMNLIPTLIRADTNRNQLFFVNESTEGGSSINKMPYAVSPEGGVAIYRTKGQILTMTIDVKREEVYWTEQIKTVNTLHRMRSYGQAPVTLFRSEDRRLSFLNFLDNTLFYIDSKRHEFGYYNGSGFHSVHAGVKNVKDFTILHKPTKTKERKNSCQVKNGGCSEFCLQSIDGKHQCTCSDHKFIDKDSTFCSYEQHGLVLASTDRLLLMTAESVEAMVSKDHSPITILPVERVGLPLSMTIDDLSRQLTIYWIDANDPKYVKSVSARVTTSTAPLLFHVNVCSQLRSLAIDTLGRQLFVSCSASSGKSHVLVFRIQSSTMAVPDRLLHIGRVINGDEISPLTGSYPVPTEMAAGARKLVFLDVGSRSGTPILVVCDIDGRQCRKASERTHPSSRMSVLPNLNKLLYTSDDSINMMDLSALVSSPHMQLPLRNSRVLFTPLDPSHLAILPMDEREELILGETSIRMPGSVRISAIAAYTSQENSPFERARSCFHQECSHLCSYTGDGYECLCPLGFTISHESSFVCVQNITCEPWEFLCKDQRTCVHSGSKCDNRRNCPDGSDESIEMCTGLDPTLWQCSDQLMFIDRMKVCDGVTNCADGSDERGCKCSVPSAEMDCAIFGRMQQSECILRRLRCDHHVDCSNGADEDERLCTIFPVEPIGFHISFTHILYASFAFLLALASCPIVLFFCFRKNMDTTTNASSSDRRYNPLSEPDPSLLIPLATNNDQFEMRAYSIVDSTSTYPSLPPPLPSLCGSSVQTEMRDPYRNRRDHPSRFYAPPPSTASLSTYGIVMPQYNDSTMTRQIIITEHVPTPSLASHSHHSHGISPPPAYKGGSTREKKRKKTPAGSHSSSSNSNRQGSTRHRPSIEREMPLSEDSLSLSSHSSEGALPHSYKGRVSSRPGLM